MSYNDWEMARRQAEINKTAYPEGTRIVLIQMGDDPRPIPPNTRGTVRHVDSLGTIHCDFDNGRYLGLIPGEDVFRYLNEKEIAEELLDDKADFLVDFFWAQKITMSVDSVGGKLVAKDDEGNKWCDAEIYDFALNECLCFEADGSLSSGLAAAEPFVERLKEDAKEYGVEVTAFVKSVDELIGEAKEKSESVMVTQLPYLSQCEDFEAIKKAFSSDMLTHIEENIRLYEETDLIEVDEDTLELYHKEGKDVFQSAIAWYEGSMLTEDFISEYGDVDFSREDRTLEDM